MPALIFLSLRVLAADGVDLAVAELGAVAEEPAAVAELEGVAAELPAAGIDEQAGSLLA